MVTNTALRRRSRTCLQNKTKEKRGYVSEVSPRIGKSTRCAICQVIVSELIGKHSLTSTGWFPIPVPMLYALIIGIILAPVQTDRLRDDDHCFSYITIFGNVPDRQDGLLPSAPTWKLF